MRMRASESQVEDGSGRRHHPEATDHHVVDRVEPLGRVDGERQQCRSPGPFDGELDGVGR